MATNKNHNKYETVSEYIKDIETAETSRLFQKNVGENRLSSRTEEKDGETWYCTKNYAAAADLLANGDAAAAAKIDDGVKAKFAKCATVADAIVKKHRLSIVGGSVNVPAYLAGSPRCMRRQITKKVRSKVLTIVYANTAPWHVGGDELADVNANVVSAIMAIEKAGYRVNLYLLQASSTRDMKNTCSALIKIKNSGAYINILNMAYTLINPSFFRRHNFRYIETRKKLGGGRDWTVRYGFQASERIKKSILKDEYALKYDVLINFGDIRNDTPEQIIKRVIK